MAGVRLRPGLERALAGSPEMKALTARTAAHVAQVAREIAPVADVTDDPTPGEFRDSIKSDGNSVYTDHRAGAYILFGTSDTPPHDTFQRAAESVGLHLRAR